MRWSALLLLPALSASFACATKREVVKDDPNWRIPAATSVDAVAVDESPVWQPVDFGVDLLEFEGMTPEQRRALPGATDDRNWTPGGLEVALAAPADDASPGSPAAAADEPDAPAAGAGAATKVGSSAATDPVPATRPEAVPAAAKRPVPATVESAVPPMADELPIDDSPDDVEERDDEDAPTRNP